MLIKFKSMTVYGDLQSNSADSTHIKLTEIDFPSSLKYTTLSLHNSKMLRLRQYGMC